jgi:predicted enzyme related to lactoylglutathione lyase
VLVDDQAKAHAFYTDILGFVTKLDFPVGEDRWLTVVSPDDPDGVQLLLEPNNNPALNGLAQTYQRTLHDNGIAAAAFAVADIHQEAERLKQRGVSFTQEPTEMGGVTAAIFDDTCGNLIQMFQAA